MKKNVKMGVYTRNGESISFNFYTNLCAVDKMKFVDNVTSYVVGDNYNSVIRDMMFDFTIIDIFTDVDITEIVNSKTDSINMIEDLLNETDIATIVRANAESGLISELEKAVNDNIEYRTGVHRNPIADSFSSLLNAIENKLAGIDTDSMMQMAQVISGMSGEMTPERVWETYSKSNIFKEHYAKLLADRKRHDTAIDDIGVIKNSANNDEKINAEK